MRSSKFGTRSLVDFVRESARIILRRPGYLTWIVLAYATISFFFLLYERTRRQEMDALKQIELQKQRIAMLEEERQLWSMELSNSKSGDLFKRLSFADAKEAPNEPKLRTALSLNTFAIYALDRGDIQKAKDLLDQSVQTYPTSEAKYYQGVISYKQGKAADAAAVWGQLAKNCSVPKDVYLYLSMAEYKAGNTEAAKAYAETYSQSEFLRRP